MYKGYQLCTYMYIQTVWSLLKSKALSFYCWKQLNLSILVMGILSFLKRITKLIVDRTRKYFVGHLFTFSFQIIIIANWRIVYHILTSSETRLQLDYPYTSYKSVMSLYMYVIHRPVSIKTKWRFVLNFTKNIVPKILDKTFKYSLHSHIKFCLKILWVVPYCRVVKNWYKNPLNICNISLCYISGNNYVTVMRIKTRDKARKQ